MMFERGKNVLLKLNRFKPKGDISLLIVVTFLTFFGVLMVYSASMYTAKVLYDDSFFFMKKQLIGAVLGLVAMISITFFDHKKLIKCKWFALVISLVLLALIFIPGLGKESYGAKRWIRLGGITIQPSEFAKYGFVIFSASHIAKNREKIGKFTTILPILIAGGSICLLVMLEPNMSITMCIAFVMCIMIFLSGTKLKNLLIIGIPILLAVPLLIIIEPYRMQRLYAFINPWASPKGEGYQLIQSLYGLGNGGWFGVGLFNSRQKYRFLPFAESDFILTIIGEEFGFVGIAILFLIDGFVIYKGMSISSRADNLFSSMLALGITLVYGVQVIVNTCVVSGLIPPTGLPLPLISSGNTSLIVTMSSFGVLYNISKQSKEHI